MLAVRQIWKKAPEKLLSTPIKLYISYCNLAEMRNVRMAHEGRRYGTICKHMLPSNYNTLLLSNYLHIVSVSIDYTKHVIKSLHFFEENMGQWISFLSLERKVHYVSIWK